MFIEVKRFAVCMLQETHVEAHTQSLTPGQRLGFKDVDPEMAVEVVIRMAGFTYRGTAGQPRALKGS